MQVSVEVVSNALQLSNSVIIGSTCCRLVFSFVKTLKAVASVCPMSCCCSDGNSDSVMQVSVEVVSNALQLSDSVIIGSTCCRLVFSFIKTLTAFASVCPVSCCCSCICCTFFAKRVFKTDDIDAEAAAAGDDNDDDNERANSDFTFGFSSGQSSRKELESVTSLSAFEQSRALLPFSS